MEPVVLLSKVALTSKASSRSARTLHAWHIPARYEAAAGHPLVHAAERASFLGAGIAPMTDQNRSGTVLTIEGRRLTSSNWS